MGIETFAEEDQLGAQVRLKSFYHQVKEGFPEEVVGSQQ